MSNFCEIYRLKIKGGLMGFKGFKFGMLLQLAVGPICLFIFQTTVQSGFIPGISGVAGVTLIDGLYILTAIFGIGSLLEKVPTLQKYLKYFGGLVLIVFGLSNILILFGITIIPSFNNAGNVENVLLKTMLLTLSNPLTILFWAGVFSTKIVEENLSKKEMYQFGFGAMFATLSFLTLVVCIGLGFKSFAPEIIIQMLNGAVGVILTYFGMRILVRAK